LSQKQLAASVCRAASAAREKLLESLQEIVHTSARLPDAPLQDVHFVGYF
jgi:hypothetical protein